MNLKDILISFLPFSKGDTRVILMYATDMPQISAANTSLPQISAANTSMTGVSPFENGRNEKIMSSN